MIGQITPLVQAAKRTWVKTVGGHMAGSTLAAAAFGFALGTVGLAISVLGLDLPAGLVVGPVALACAAQGLDLVRWRLPMLRRQTPSWYTCAFGTVGGGFLWGADLGLGWTTLVIFPGYYVLVVAAFCGASPLLGALVLAAYGMGRALPAAWAGLLAGRFPLHWLAVAHVRLMGRLHKINGPRSRSLPDTCS